MNRPRGLDIPPATDRGARSSAWMALGALLVAVVAAPFGIDLSGAAFGRLVDGVVVVAGPDGGRALEVPETLPEGARLRVGEQAARIEVAGGALTLAEDTEVVAHAAGPRVLRGSVLVEADQPLVVEVGATTAEGQGTWRVDVGAASRVATYAGRLHIADDQHERDVPRLRQVGVRDGALEPGMRPLRYEEQDPWDQWLLADALAVDRLVERLQAGLERTHGRAPRDAEFYAAFVAIEDAGLASELGDLAVTVEGDTFGPPADLLTAVAAIDALRAEGDLALDEARQRVVELRRAGASWGLLLVEHRLGAGALRAAADRALEQVQVTPPPDPPEPVEPPGPEGPEEPEEDAPAVLPVAQEPAAPPESDGEPESPVAPEPPPGPADEQPSAQDEDPPPPTDEALSPVTDAVRETGGSVGDLVSSAGEAVGGLVEDSTRSVGELLESTTETVADTVDGLASILVGGG